MGALDVRVETGLALAAEGAELALEYAVQPKALVLARAVRLAGWVLPPPILECSNDIGSCTRQFGSSLPLVDAMLGLEVAEQEGLQAMDGLLWVEVRLWVRVDADGAAAGDAEHEWPVWVLDDLEEVDVSFHCGI